MNSPQQSVVSKPAATPPKARAFGGSLEKEMNAMMKTARHVAITPEKLVNEIERRAHAIYLQRGAAPGSDLTDWLQAEREIKAKYGIKG
jgi:hypothetical protein